MKIPKLSLPTKLKISLPNKKNNGSNDIPFSREASRDAKSTKLLRCAIVVLAAVLGFLIINDHNAKKTSRMPVASSEMQNQSAAKTVNSQKKEKLHITMDIAAVNPFLADNEIEDIAAASSDEDVRQESMYRGSAASANLPVIPGYQPKPNLPQIPNNRNSEINSKEYSQKQPAKVQGVFIGGKSSMAIMSDGTVVSEGEYYNDNRISWIGGDGIHFENGESIKYR